MNESAIQSSAEVFAHVTEKKLMRVLHVDDECGFLEVSKLCLEIQGRFHVDTALSVDKALERLRKEKYDVVVSDYLMPGKDGLDFLKELREEGNTIPFIMFSGKGKEEVAIEALSLGANQYLRKDGNPETVYSELAHAIENAVKPSKRKKNLKFIEKVTGDIPKYLQT